MTYADVAFPGLATALDTDATLDLLRAHFRRARADVALRSVDVVDVRYEPGRRCDLLYRVRGDDPLTGKGTRQLLAARLVRADDRPAEPPRALVERYRAAAPALIPMPWAFLDQLRLELHAHPVDAHMPSLFDALSADHMARRFERLWAARKLRVRSVQLESLGYTPAARAAFAYEVLAESRKTREPELRRLIGKMHAKKPAARLFSGAWALWSAARGRIEFAPPVGFDAVTNLTFQERVEGERLGSLAKNGAFVRHVRQTAKYIARLHRLELPLATRRKPQEEAGVVHRWSAVLTTIRPDLAPRIAALRDRLAAELERRVELKAPVHGDFHHTNVLVAGDRVTIIDLDEMAFGDPLLDVGRFMASMRIPSLRAFGTLDGLEGAREAFLREYLLNNAEDERRARLFEAATLFTAAASAFRIQRASWSDEVELLVDEAERVFTTACAGLSQPVPAAPVQPPPAFTPTADPPPSLRDRMYMRAMLAPELEQACGVELGTVVDVEPSDGGERVEYGIEGWRGEERWKGRIVGTIATNGGAGMLQRVGLLRAALRDVPHAPLLPQPVGYIRSLPLVVFEAVRGKSLLALLGTAEGKAAAGRFGRALGALHRTPLDTERARPLSRELAALADQIDELRTAQPSLAGWAAELHAEIVRRCEHGDEPIAPSIRPLLPQHVLIRNDAVAFDRIDDVVLADPRFDLGDVLARITVAASRRRRPAEAEAFVASVRDGYDDVNAVRGVDTGLQAAIESAALIRYACSQAARDPELHVAEALIRRASLLLGC
jgi:aminoglycoside phosphotransferase (APT) family kinase protein